MTQPASAWAASMTRQRTEVNALAAAALAGGSARTAVAEALRAAGVGFDRQVSPAAQPDAVDGWALALARATLCSLTARLWSPRTATPWTLSHLVPTLVPHLDPRLRGAEGTGYAPAEAAGTVADLAYAADQAWRFADVRQWGDLLLAAATASVAPMRRAELRDVGVVAAWRAGHVRLRDAAHRVAADLPPRVLAAASGLPVEADPHAAFEDNGTDPTSWPNPVVAQGNPRGDQALRQVGGFVAFGGPFLVPPRVTAGDGVVWRLEAAGSWELLVDVHGAYLRRIPATGRTPDEPGAGPVRLQRGRAVLVTSPRSHTLVYARAAADA